MVCPEFQNLGCIYQRYSVHAFFFASITSDPQFPLTSSRDWMPLISCLQHAYQVIMIRPESEIFMSSQMPKRHSHFRRQFHLRRQWLIMNPVANYEPKFLVKYGIWCRGKLKGVISHNVGRHLFVFSCLQFLSSSHLLLTF